MTYRALARTYRSKHFGELIGQDVLVRTLSNAIENNRIHHAYMLTGVRGVGKTSTARILAKAINYVGPNGDGKPTTGPTDDCPICVAINEGRHPDVIEIDAASNTGVDDVRQIIENVRYAPTEARYKVFIIDEVHMLSKQAFNALLKTLEEPPPHIVFLFATTEIRKVPVTILSRCQRFDLRRIDAPVLADHYKKIADAEKIAIDDDALQLVARAADGSARDGLSILDQAIAQAGGQTISAKLVRDMLGRGDSQVVAELFGHVMRGDVGQALALLEQMHHNGAEPAMILDDLLDFTHLITRVKVVPALADEPSLSGGLRDRAKEFASQFELSSLSRVWQMLLKAVSEVAQAPQPVQALEMAVIRVAFAAPLPPLEEMLKKSPVSDTAAVSAPVAPPSTPRPTTSAPPARMTAAVAAQKTVAAPSPEPAPTAQLQAQPENAVHIADFPALVSLCEEKNAHQLAADLFTNVRPVKFQHGQMQINIQRGAQKDMIGLLQKKLHEWTGDRWMIAVSTSEGEPTLAERAVQQKNAALTAAGEDPAVAALKNILPNLSITDLKTE